MQVASRVLLDTAVQSCATNCSVRGFKCAYIIPLRKREVVLDCRGVASAIVTSEY